VLNTQLSQPITDKSKQRSKTCTATHTHTQCQHQKTSYQRAWRQISLWANSTLHRTAGQFDYIRPSHSQHVNSDLSSCLLTAAGLLSTITVYIRHFIRQ